MRCKVFANTHWLGIFCAGLFGLVVLAVSFRGAIAEDCTHAAAVCNTYEFFHDHCCVNEDEDVRIVNCTHPTLGSPLKYVIRGTHRCADLVAVVEGVCDTVVIEDCGGDVAIGSCDNVNCIEVVDVPLP